MTPITNTGIGNARCPAEAQLPWPVWTAAAMLLPLMWAVKTW